MSKRLYVSKRGGFMDIVVLDDDINFVKKIRNDISNYFFLIDKELNIITVTEKFNFLDELRVEKIDIIFLDIDLKDKYNGFNIAKVVKKIFPNIIIVFVSSNNDFVFPALSIDFFQFIRKNCYDDDVPIVFSQLKEYYIKNHKGIIVEINKRKVLIKLNEIIYILSIGHELFIKTVSKEYRIAISLIKFMKKIDFNYLVQIQRNLVINLCFAEDVLRTSVILSDGKKYKVGRKYQSNLLNMYEEFLLR